MRTRAILWAQWRTVRNRLPRAGKGGLLFSVVLGFVWYGGFTWLAIAAAMLMSNPDQIPFASSALQGGLFAAFLYWQAIPLLLVSTGSALDIKKLLIYPIAKNELFRLEVLLRVTTGVEVLIVLAGAAIGLLLNPRIPAWGPLALVVFAMFNLLVSAGVRDLVARLFARKGIREIMMILFVLAAGMPQLLVLTGNRNQFRAIAGVFSSVAWPWMATARLAQGHFTAAGAASLLAWTLAAYLFGRWQFERGLTFDEQEQAQDRGQGRFGGLLESFYRFPGRLFADPLGALIEKELRFQSRSPRFRLVFLMGFSFGLLIWLPMALGKTGIGNSWMARNYLSLVSAYALLLLSDVLFWNAFGFDRSAAQLYFLAPVKIRTVLLAKNLSAVIWILLELALVITVCAILRLPMSAGSIVEALSATLTVALLLVSVGNLSSFYNPKPVDPAKSFRNSAGRQTQLVLMLCFPVALMPVTLAYAARYAFQTQAAYFGVLLLAVLFGLVLYRIAADSAVATAERNKESIVSALSGGQGPVGG